MGTEETNWKLTNEEMYYLTIKLFQIKMRCYVFTCQIGKLKRKPSEA